jgi:hypothetical protein
VSQPVLLTPKWHAGLAGESVEYFCACAKGAYRNMSLKEKKRKRQLQGQWRPSLSVKRGDHKSENTKFAQRARQYLMANIMPLIQDSWMNKHLLIAKSTVQPITLTKLIIQFKTHRCAYDFDHKFVLNA